jgi:hypothetical protein
MGGYPVTDNISSLLFRPAHQVLTLENWELYMYSVIRASGYIASIYFISWVIIGKYVFLSLFMAVTLEAFESKFESEGQKSLPVLTASPSMKFGVAAAHPGEGKQ